MEHTREVVTRHTIVLEGNERGILQNILNQWEDKCPGAHSNLKHLARELREALVRD